MGKLALAFSVGVRGNEADRKQPRSSIAALPASGPGSSRAAGCHRDLGQDEPRSSSHCR